MGNFYSYMRISTDTERQNFARQENALKRYAEKHGIESPSIPVSLLKALHCAFPPPPMQKSCRLSAYSTQHLSAL